MSAADERLWRYMHLFSMDVKSMHVTSGWHHGADRWQPVRDVDRLRFIDLHVSRCRPIWVGSRARVVDRKVQSNFLALHVRGEDAAHTAPPLAVVLALIEALDPAGAEPLLLRSRTYCEVLYPLPRLQPLSPLLRGNAGRALRTVIESVDDRVLVEIFPDRSSTWQWPLGYAEDFCDPVTGTPILLPDIDSMLDLVETWRSRAHFLTVDGLLRVHMATAGVARRTNGARAPP